METKTEKKPNGCISGLVGLVIVLLVIGGLFYALSSCFNRGDDVKADNTATIITCAKQEVEKQLISPKSASYPWGYDEYKIVEGASDREGYIRYTVSGYVDSENALGASLRSNFIVVLDLKGDSYYTISCTLE